MTAIRTTLSLVVLAATLPACRSGSTASPHAAAPPAPVAPPTDPVAAARARTPLIRYYDVRDLFAGSSPASLERELRTEVRPDLWAADPEATVEARNGVAIVRARSELHDAVHQHFDRLRRSRDATTPR